MNEKASLPASYFEQMYQQNIDPWNFENSDYEHKKYQATLQALPHTRYQHAFEIGCSIGVLTSMLAPLCEKLLSVDGSSIALDKARQRLLTYDHVCLKQMKVPDEYPEDTFDLILISEVGYYWSWQDMETMQQHILKSLRPEGHLLLVHWTPFVEEYPLTGDQVHQAFHDLARREGRLKHLKYQRETKYRLDLFEKAH